MNILIIRFSALGDVAISAIAVESILSANPTINVWMLSKAQHQPLFNKNPRLHFIPTDFKGKHKGLKGLKQLAKEITAQHKIEVVVDLHDVLRSKVLRFFFKLKGIKTYCFDKGRKEKNSLLKNNKPFEKLPHTIDRYLNCFKQIGLNAYLAESPWLKTQPDLNFSTASNKKKIGIAPFAAHKSKEWELAKITKLIGQLKEFDVFLFGAGNQEIQKLNALANNYPHCHNLAGKYSLETELNIISSLDLMVSMDSANMHLASLVDTKVISIWGPTHYYMGFGPLKNEKLIVEVSKDELPCRPCSIYGKLYSEKQKNCAKVSMDKISVSTVKKKVVEVLKQED